MNAHKNYPSLDSFEITQLKANDLASALNKALLDLKTNSYFICITYKYKDGYPALCCQYSDYIEWVPWEENRFLFIKAKNTNSKN